jgi:hypothetical protein
MRQPVEKTRGAPQWVRSQAWPTVGMTSENVFSLF